ncbi:transposase [Streptomyces sp. NPDC003006]
MSESVSELEFPRTPRTRTPRTKSGRSSSPYCRRRPGAQRAVAGPRHPRRAIFDAIPYVCSEGCRWRSLPADFPPSPTVCGFFRRWTKSGVWDMLRDHPRREVRCRMGTSPHAVATVLDSQSARHRQPSARTPGAETAAK